MLGSLWEASELLDVDLWEGQLQDDFSLNPYMN